MRRQVSLSLSVIATALSRSPLRDMRLISSSGMYWEVTIVGLIAS